MIGSAASGAKSIQQRPSHESNPVAGEIADPLFAHSFDEGLAGGIRNIGIDLPAGFHLAGRLYGPAAPNGAAVVMMHGCSGLWSDGQPDTVAQAAIEKWGAELARTGYFALAIDSYSARTPPGIDPAAFQRQCTGDVYEGAVDPYTTRVDDMDAGVAWLRYRLGIASTQRIAALGWSQGAQSVLVRSAETYRDIDASRFDAPQAETAAQIASIAFYPGCGTRLGFVDGDLASSYWRPHRDIRINHGGADPLHDACAQRAAIAQASYASVPDSGHWVDYVEYPGANHSFDAAIPDWPTTRCAPDAPASDLCAAIDADIDSMEFLSARMHVAAEP